MQHGKYAGDRAAAEQSGIILAPFTPDQVIALERYQRGTGKVRFHPFTCGGGNRQDGLHRENEVDLAALVPTVRGWICPFCDYTQDWAHAFMAEA